jgi:phosphatidylglycerol:prolipoprotein diacylglycerol transferase
MNGYALILGIGASLGCWAVARKAQQAQAARLITISLITLLGCLIGARLLYTIFHFDYYGVHLLEVPQFWLGGFSWPGAFLGGILTILVIARWEKSPVPRLADSLSHLFPPLAIGFWLGCWQAGCAYGERISGAPWWALPARDETGVIAHRFPLQLVAALFLLFFFLILEARTSSFDRPGQLASMTAMGLSLNAMLFSVFRADGMVFYGVRVDLIASAIFLFSSMAMAALAFRPHALVR